MPDVTQQDVTSDGKRPNEPDAQVRWWLTEFAAARRREKEWREDGERITRIYEVEDKDSIAFPILTSNVETLMPALYSALPRPVVQRRFKDADPLGKMAADAARRLLEFLLDTNVDQYESFDEAMQAAVLDALVPGRGVTTVKYDADLRGEADSEDASYVAAELVCLKSRVWQRVLFGYAKKWVDLPWLAFEEHIDRDEATRLFGEQIAAKLVYTDEERPERDQDSPREAEQQNLGQRQTVCVYQIWDKDGGKKVRYISAQYYEGYLKEEDDPLGLTGFYPIPRPLQFVQKANLIPTAPYRIYEHQARELNRLTVRIKRIIEAIKARGVYDGSLGEDLEKIMESDDNTLVPADKSSSLAAEKGLDNAIWFMPVEHLIVVLRELYAAREQAKQVIYEITGISDIIRGSTKASETLGAQQLKSQWGTLRLKRQQREVQRYARDLLRMMLELAATKLGEETWAKMTGLPLLTATQAQQVQALAQAAQVAAQQGQPLDPARAQQIQQMLAVPRWSQILGLLKNDLARAYRIDIETNSTVEPEAAEDQKQIAELMNALGQYLNGVAPLVLNGSLPFGAAQSMLLAISRRFRFGSEIEDEIKQMRPPQNPQEGQDQAKAKEAQLEKQALQLKEKEAQLEVQAKQREAEFSLNEQKRDLEVREAKLKLQESEFALQQQAAKEQIAMKEATYTSRRSADDRVRSIQDASTKQTAQMAQKSDQQLLKDRTAITQTAQQVTAMLPLLQSLEAQAQATQDGLRELLAAIKQPRTKRAVRGKDGRIERVVEEVA